MTPTDNRLAWYRRRVCALEELLAYYRTGKQPSEKLHAELARTRQQIGSDGCWLGAR